MRWYISAIIAIVGILVSVPLIPNITIFSELHFKYFAYFTGPTLAFIAFLRTIQVRIILDKQESKREVRTDFYDLLSLMNDYKSDIQEDIFEITQMVRQEYNYNNKYPESMVICEYGGKFYKVGPFFRTFHRIFKNLNAAYEDKVIDLKDYKAYVGTLRTQFNSDELEFILYNAVLIHRGIGLGIELVDTNFFGNKADVLINQHLDYQKYFKNELLNLFLDKDDYEKDCKAKRRIEMRANYYEIVNEINAAKNDKKRAVLVNRLTVNNFRTINNFNFKVTDEEMKSITYV